MPLWVSPAPVVDPVEIVTDPDALAALSALFATVAQGEKADTAVQPDDLASGLAGKQDADPALDALSGADVEAWGRSWLDLASQAAARSRLGLGTAALADTGDFATAAQGAKADTAVQPESLADVATSGDYSDLTGTPTLGTAAAADVGDFATAAQGAKADTAVQPESLAAVATSGAYSDLTGTPTLGTAAAANTGDFATAAQGAKADTAVQPEALAAVATSGAYSDLTGTPTLGTAAGMSPAQVVTDSTAQASLRSTFVPYVRWTGSAWPARPSDAEFVIFVSTNDASATAPNDINLAAGDYWLRHPEAA